MMRKRQKSEDHLFKDWFPKVSAVIFVFCLFAFLSGDISKLVDNAPLLFNFFFGVSILAVLIVAWNKNKLAGITFIFLGIIYLAATWNKVLVVSTIAISFWLVLTGIAFLIAEVDRLSEEKLATKKSNKRIPW